VECDRVNAWCCTFNHGSMNESINGKMRRQNRSGGIVIDNCIIERPGMRQTSSAKDVNQGPQVMFSSSSLLGDAKIGATGCLSDQYDRPI
jgi:hypothetical protein